MFSMAQVTRKLKALYYIPELRNRIVYTLLMFLVVRAGAHFALPGLNLEKIRSITGSGGGFIDFMNMMSGGAFARASIFSLGVAPYINASIIFSLLSIVVPKFEEMQREGGLGKQKITQWTRYLAILITIIHAVAAIVMLKKFDLIEEPGFLFYMNTVAILIATVTFQTWLGDRITDKGIGNGISLIIFLGIVARVPGGSARMFNTVQSGKAFWINLGMIGLLALVLTLLIVVVQLAQRKIPIHYSSVGRAQKIASKSFLPVKINNAGVMPLIFASVFMSLPSLITGVLKDGSAIKVFMVKIFSPYHPVFLSFEFLLVLFFTFFYTAIIFDPEKIAENLKKSAASIPTIRPGKETVEYLEKVIIRITLGGSIFLAFIAILPNLLTMIFGMPISIGGTGILIAVSVAVDTVQRVEGILAMEDYRSII